ncbi:cobalamin biosynthesis protein CbiG [Streptomyces sp. GS7]|nr:cobalamin biosynthesis protein CbiG [Streptomyces sp. GS7]
MRSPVPDCGHRAADSGAGRPAPALIAGVGARRGVPEAEVLELIGAVLAAAGRPPAALAALATVTAKAAEPGLLGAARRLGVPLRSYPAAALAAVPVPAPSAAVRAAAGTPSVAEAAALLAAGPGARLIAGKRASAPDGRPPMATCALAAPTGADTWGSSAITSGTEGATAARPAGADIVLPSPGPPRPGADRRTADVDGSRPVGETPGSKETL